VTPRTRIVALAMTAALAMACGGGAAPSKTPSGGSFDEMKPGEEGGGAGDPTKKKEVDKDSSAPTMTTPEAAREQLDESMKAFEAANGDCARMCKALASMQRAADHLCTLATSDDDGKKRCDEARARVSAAEDKVKASCGGCA